VTIWVYKENKKIAKMTQINQVGDLIIANDGSYSFVITQKSIKKFECHFIIKKMK